MQQVRKQFERLLTETVRAEEKARRRGEPEDWHRLRTASRRVRGALLAHAAFFEPSEHARLCRKGKRITRLPGKLRDLDVAIERLSKLREECEDEAAAQVAKQLRRALKRKRAHRVERIQRKLRRERPAMVWAVRVRAALRARVPATSTAVRSQVGVLSPYKRAILHLRDAIRDHRDVEALHRLRVAIKRYRGALAALLAISREHITDPKRKLADLQELQDVLGEHHDWSELAARITADLPASTGRKLLLARVRREQRNAYQRYRVLSARLYALLAATVSLLTLWS